MNIKEINKLLSQQTLQKIQDNYSTALGIPLTIINSDCETLTEPSNQSKLWNIIKDHPEFGIGSEDKLVDSIHKCERTGQLVIFERHTNCFGFCAPIYANGQIIAYFVGGFVRFGNPDIDTAEKFAQKLNIEIDTYLDAFLALPFFTEEKLEASAKLIKIIGTTIYTLENEGSEIREKNQEFQKINLKLNKNLQQATNQLIASENLYKQIFDNVNDGIFVSYIEEGTFHEINKAGAQILGYKTPKQVINKKVSDCYATPKDRTEFENKLQSSGKVTNWIAHIITPQGEKKYLETNATLIKDNKTGRQLVHGIFRDLGPRKHRSL